MSGRAVTLAGRMAWLCDAAGAPLDGERAAVDIIGDAMGVGAEVVVVPTSRLGDGFLTLSTRVAGEVVQKFVNYGMRLFIAGDIAEALAASGALRDYVREANTGRHVNFAPDCAAIEARLARGGAV